MPSTMGTRTSVNQLRIRPDQGSETRSHTRDAGLTTNTGAVSLTFSAAGTITGANGTFPVANWLNNFTILVEGTNLNNGWFTITGVDNANGAFLTVDPKPKNEGPLTATVRTE